MASKRNPVKDASLRRSKRVKSVPVKDSLKNVFAEWIAPGEDPAGEDPAGEEYVPSDDDSDKEDDPEIEDSVYELDLDSLKISDNAAYKNLLIVQKNAEEIEPNILEMLKEPLRPEDKVKMLQLYESYKNIPPASKEALMSRDELIDAFRDAKLAYEEYAKYTIEEHACMEREMTKLKSYIPEFAYKYRILQLQTSDANKRVILRKYTEWKRMEKHDDEYGKLKEWLDWAVSLPYEAVKRFPFEPSAMTTFLKNAFKRLDEELYGMKHVKEQILLFINARMRNPTMKRCSLGLVGRPGTGKTAIARLMAKILDCPFEQISLGGSSNSDFLKGHNYTYVGAQPGEIVKVMRRMGFGERCCVYGRVR